MEDMVMVPPLLITLVTDMADMAMVDTVMVDMVMVDMVMDTRKSMITGDTAMVDTEDTDTAIKSVKL